MHMWLLARRWKEGQVAFAERRIWEPLGSTLLGKTACVIGSGDLGTAIAKRLHALGMQLITLLLTTFREKAQSAQGMVALVAEQTFRVERKLAPTLLSVPLESMRHIQPGPPEVQHSNIVHDIAIARVNPVQHSSHFSILRKQSMQAQTSIDQKAIFGTIHEKTTHPPVKIPIEIAL